MKTTKTIRLCAWRRISYQIAIVIMETRGWKVESVKEGFFTNRVTFVRDENRVNEDAI